MALFPGFLLEGMVLLIRVLFRDQIDLLKDYLYEI